VTWWGDDFWLQPSLRSELHATLSRMASACAGASNLPRYAME
jgi:hypothetical protein